MDATNLPTSVAEVNFEGGKMEDTQDEPSWSQAHTTSSSSAAVLGHFQ